MSSGGKGEVSFEDQEVQNRAVTRRLEGVFRALISAKSKGFDIQLHLANFRSTMEEMEHLMIIYTCRNGEKFWRKDIDDFIKQEEDIKADIDRTIENRHL